MMSPGDPISLYVHIPFCETKCPYCDFNTYSAIEPLMPTYISALQSEIALWGRLLDTPGVHTVFFGGGTPSYLPSDDIRSTMDTIRNAFRLESEAEVTLEANPGDFSESKLAVYQESGVNRLSIGVQSFDDSLLKTLGRRHSATDAVQAYLQAVDAGFDNISIDLMYALPYQSIQQWQTTLNHALELEPPHISMYCLTLEGGTPMERWVEEGSVPTPDPDLAADMYLLAQQDMQSAGYRHYEISNWARDDRRSLHNLTYWRNKPYLGVGPGAHSYVEGCRFSTIRSPREYVRRLNDASANLNGASTYDRILSVPVVDEVERIDTQMEVAETMMLGLRLDEGISLSEFTNRFGAPPAHFFSDVLNELEAIGLLDSTNGYIRLTHSGRMLGNEVFSRFFS